MLFNSVDALIQTALEAKQNPESVTQKVASVLREVRAAEKAELTARTEQFKTASGIESSQVCLAKIASLADALMALSDD